MQKIQFEILDLQVANLYAKKIDESDNDAILKHCDFIAQTIEAMGWSTEEYMDESWTRLHRSRMAN